MHAEDNVITSAKLSFLDLFFLFPHYLGDVKVSGDAVERKKNLKLPKKKDSFVYLPDVRLVYRELQLFQKIAVERLVGRGLLDADSFKNQKAQLNVDAVPSEIKSLIDEQFSKKHDLLSYLVHDINSLPIDGAGSLLRQSRLELGGRFK